MIGTAGRISRWAARAEGLSPSAHLRVTILDWHEGHGHNVSRTAWHYGLARKRVRQWLWRLAFEKVFEDYLLPSDDPDAVVSFIESHPPV